MTAAVRFLAGDLAGTLAAAGEALERLPAALHHARGGAAVYAVQAALALEGGDAARRWLDAAAATGLPDGRDDRAVAWALVGLGAGLLWAGRLTEAEAAGRALLRQGAVLGIAHCRHWGHVVLGAVHYERGESAAAAGHFAAALAEPDATPLLVQREATFGLALVRQAQGRPAEADAAVDRLAGALLATGNTGQLAVVAAFRARLALRRDDAAAVRTWLRDAGDAALRWRGALLDSPPLTRAWARLRLAAEAPEPAAARTAAAAELDAVLAETVRLHAGRGQAAALALRALVLDASGDEAAALDALARAVALAAPGGLRRTLLDLDPPLGRLLGRLAAGRPTAFLRELRAEGPPAAPGAGHPEALPEPLTGRELEVLTRLGRRWSNKEIAADLHLSPETVKTYVAHVAAKLGVSGRREAVRRAEELRLLPPAPA